MNLVSQIVVPMPHQPLRVSVRFRQKPRANEQRLILRKDYVELNFQFLTLVFRQGQDPLGQQLDGRSMYAMRAQGGHLPGTPRGNPLEQNRTLR